MDIKIIEMSPNEIENSLKNYEIHIGVTSIFNKDNENEMNYIPIFEERLILITPLEHRLENFSSIDISELQNETLIHSLTGYNVRESLIEAYQKIEYIPRINYETESLETARVLVESGLGVSVVPEAS